jgi:hypothetical protein
MKTCKMCNEEKPFDQFLKTKVADKEYYKSYCNKCYPEKMNQYSSKKKEERGFVKLTLEEAKKRNNECAKRYMKQNRDKVYAYQKEVFNSLGSGVYKITNTINNKIYIGSSKQLYRRKVTHFSELTNTTCSCPNLQSDMNEYGKDKFTFDILEHCEPEQLLEREHYYINQLNPEYNTKK